jgi:hypothetical protein
MSIFDEQQAKLERQWEASTDPAFRAAYALAKRAGFRWYNTESAARRMAEHAAEELLALIGLLEELVAIEGPQPGHVDWYRKVQATLKKFKGGAA